MRARSRLLNSLLAGVLFSLCSNAPAEGIPSDVMERIGNIVPGLSEGAVHETPLPGIYGVQVSGRIIYVSGDGRYLFRGDIIDVVKRENLSENRRQGARIAEIGRLDQAGMVAFKPKETKHVVTVFTDVDCGYCAKLHREMKDYNQLGIEVRYLAFPRAGIGSKSHKKMVSVWCADDQQQAMTDAKARRRVQPAECENPVEQHFELGRVLGVNGTPTMILADGRVVPGYLPPERLIKEIEGGR